MNDDFPFIDIVILALVVGFILLRLRSVLGQKIGLDMPQFRVGDQVVQVNVLSSAEKPEDKDEDTALISALDTAAADAIARLKKVDAQFSLTHFLLGARSAFEMVFDAFIKDDRETLKNLMSPALYDIFSAELERRKTQELRQETTLLAVISQELAEASLDKNMARLRVRFVSDQVTLERDRENKIVSGDPSKNDHVQDEWTFERDVTSRNPNWNIIET